MRLALIAAVATLAFAGAAKAGNTSTNTSNNSSTNTSSDPWSSNSSSNRSSNSSGRRGRVDDWRRDERIDERRDGPYVDWRYELREEHRAERDRWRRRAIERGEGYRDDEDDD